MYTHTEAHLPQGWGSRDTLPGPDGAAGSGPGRTGPVCPNTPSVCPCFLARGWWDWRSQALVGGFRFSWVAEWSWEDRAPLIEPRWAWTGDGAKPELGPTLCTTPLCSSRCDSHSPVPSLVFPLTSFLSHSHLHAFALHSYTCELLHWPHY